jgi:glycosyltransferase involved in cell wall biosynthesis
MGAQEGIPYLLEAARYIVRDLGRGDVHFTLVGGGPELETLRAQADAMQLNDVLNFTGRVPDDELLAVLNTASVCVNADEFNEMNDKSTMNKVLEYMALGKPIVQFDLTEGRVSAGEASLYAARNDAQDLGDQIVQLLDDPAQREAMGRIGRERIESELSWAHQVPTLLAAYEAALGPARRAPEPSRPDAAGATE